MRPRPPRARLTPTLVALILLGAACGSDSSRETTRPPDDLTVDGPTADEASFSVVAYQGEDLLGGSEITFDSLLGHGTPVVVNYWAAQCPPCRAEMPWFQAAYEQHADRVLLVGIDVGRFTGFGTNEQGAQLLEDLDITYPAVYAVDDTPLRHFEILSMPSTVLFDAAGEVVGNYAGIMTEQRIEDWFIKLAAGAE